MTENIIIIMMIIIFYFIGANDRKIKELKEKYENKGTEKQKQDEATKKEMEKAKINLVKEKKAASEVARDLLYPLEVRDAIWSARTENEISRILATARKKYL